MIPIALLALLGCPTEGDSTGSQDTADSSPAADTAACDTSVERYLDGDGDGYGGGATAGGCEGVDLPGDCDDSDAGVHPYAGDVCANGVDEDCSGGDRGCGNYAPSDSSIDVNLGQGWGDAERAVADRRAAAEPTRLVIGNGSTGYLGALDLRAGEHEPSELLRATWTESDGVGTYFFWGSWVVAANAGEPGLFASYAPPYDGRVEGIRRFDSPWGGDRTDTEADAIWASDGGFAELYVGPEAAADGSDRIFVLAAPGPGATYIVAPEASSGALDAVASTHVEGGWLRPAGDLNGDGVNDMLAFRQDGPDWLQGAAYGPIDAGALAFADLLDREWAVGNEPATVGDLDGDGLADIAQSDSTEVAWGVFERSVLIFSGDAPTGSPSDRAWLTIQNDPCGEYWTGEDYAGHMWTYCEDDLRPIGVGDLDSDGTDDLVVQGVYPTAEDATSGAVVLLHPSTGVLELAEGPAAGVINVDPGVGGEWEPATDDVNLLPHHGAFSTDFDGDGALDLFFFGTFDETAPMPGNYLLGFRGPIE